MKLKWPDDFINKVICGDCLQIMKEIPEGAVDLVLTDPPYGMKSVSSWRTQKFDPIDNDFAEDLEWYAAFANHAFRTLKADTHLYSFCNDYSISDYRMLLQQNRFTPKRTLVWVKNNHTFGDLGGDYGNKVEFILYSQKGRRLLNGKRCSNVLEFDRVANLVHPTEKPIPLMSFLIQKSSDPGNIILDPFAGSGTTLVAAKQLGRRYISIEINPEYCKIAEDRLRQKELF